MLLDVMKWQAKVHVHHKMGTMLRKHAAHHARCLVLRDFAKERQYCSIGSVLDGGMAEYRSIGCGIATLDDGDHWE